MNATATASSRPAAPLSAPPPKSRRVSWEVFQQRYLTREDGYTYEWVDGRVEKRKNQQHFFIQGNLTKLFNLLFFEKKATGQLIAEGDMFFAGNHRRPDMAYLDGSQIAKMAKVEAAIPAFVIEIVSKNDQVHLLHQKMRDYRAAGVQVVWHVLPGLEEVHVFSGPALGQVAICCGQDRCTVAPVLPDFALPAADIFKIIE